MARLAIVVVVVVESVDVCLLTMI